MPSAHKRRPFAQFSLRTLFALLTLSAVGTAIWYRWPYVETRNVSSGSATFLPALRGQPVKEVARFRRQWGGEPVRHGWSRCYAASGVLLSEELWSEGRREGPSRTWFSTGKLESIGAYQRHEKTGLWKVKLPPSIRMAYSKYGAMRLVIGHSSQQSWQGGLPHGAWEYYDANRTVVRSLEFRDGLLVRADGQAAFDPLMEKLQAGLIDDRRVQSFIADSLSDWEGRDLKQQLDILRRFESLPIATDLRPERFGGAKIAGIHFEDTCGMPASAALNCLLLPHGVVADYRFGIITFCTATSAKQWRDRTGVNDLQLPPGSSLAAAWLKPTQVFFHYTPLREVFDRLSRQTRIQFDHSRLSSQFHLQSLPIILTSNDLTLKNCLGIICDDSGLHVRAQGDTLVIEPVEYRHERNERQAGRLSKTGNLGG